MMLYTAVIPHCNGMGRPAKPALKINVFHVPEKKIKG
jgi:hypothetical protein